MSPLTNHFFNISTAGTGEISSKALSFGCPLSPKVAKMIQHGRSRVVYGRMYLSMIGVAVLVVLTGKPSGCSYAARCKLVEKTERS